MVKRVRPDSESETTSLDKVKATRLAAEKGSSDVKGLTVKKLDDLFSLDKTKAIKLVAKKGNVHQTLLRLREEIDLGLSEAEKFDSGVNAPGARIRKHLLYVQKISTVLRGAISTIKANR